MCPDFLYLKHTKSLFSFHLSWSPWDEDFFLKESLLEVNLLPLNFSPLVNLLKFLMIRAKSSSFSLSFSSSTSSYSLVVALKAMLFFFLSSPFCCFFTKLILYVINDPMSSSKGSLVKSLAS